MLVMWKILVVMLSYGVGYVFVVFDVVFGVLINVGYVFIVSYVVPGKCWLCVCSVLCVKCMISCVFMSILWECFYNLMHKFQKFGEH